SAGASPLGAPGVHEPKATTAASSNPAACLRPLCRAGVITHLSVGPISAQTRRERTAAATQLVQQGLGVDRLLPLRMGTRPRPLIGWKQPLPDHEVAHDRRVTQSYTQSV